MEPAPTCLRTSSSVLLTFSLNSGRGKPGSCDSCAIFSSRVICCRRLLALSRTCWSVSEFVDDACPAACPRWATVANSVIREYIAQRSAIRFPIPFPPFPQRTAASIYLPDRGRTAAEHATSLDSLHCANISNPPTRSSNRGTFRRRDHPED